MTYEYTDEHDPRILTLQSEANVMIGELMRMRTKLRVQGFDVTGVVLPNRFDVKYVGEGADPNHPRGTIMHLPITLSPDDEWGLVVGVKADLIDELAKVVRTFAEDLEITEERRADG